MLYLKSVSTVIKNEMKKERKKKTYNRPKRCHMTSLKHISHCPSRPSLDQTYIHHGTCHSTTSTWFIFRCHELHVYIYLYTLPRNAFFFPPKFFVSLPQLHTMCCVVWAQVFLSFCLIFLLTNICVHIGLSTTSGERCHHYHNAAAQWKDDDAMGPKGVL